MFIISRTEPKRRIRDIPIETPKLPPFTYRRSNSHKRPAPHKRQTSPRGHFEKLESRVVLSTTWAITPSTLPVDVVNVAYDQLINTTDSNSVTLAVSNLKKAIPGITVPSSGTNSLLINGTPTAAGTETFTVTATDSVTGKTPTAKYSLVVNPVLSLTPATLPGDTVNAAYSQAITFSGGIGPVNFGVNITQAIAGLAVASGTLVSRSAVRPRPRGRNLHGYRQGLRDPASVGGRHQLQHHDQPRR